MKFALLFLLTVSAFSEEAAKPDLQKELAAWKSYAKQLEAKNALFDRMLGACVGPAPTMPPELKEVAQ